MGLPTDKSTQDWYPEGGFYEGRANQGESTWEDNASFDPPVPVATEDMRADNRSTSVSWGTLTAEDPYKQGPTQVWGSGGDSESSQ